jgi:hypothetical protein
MPRRFISLITSRPNAVSPRISPVSPDDPPMSLLTDQVSVM